MSIVLKKIDLDPWHPVWPHMSRFIKHEKVQYAEGKAEYNITFEIQSHKYHGRIVYQDENQSYFEVYQEVNVKDESPTKHVDKFEKSADPVPVPDGAKDSPDSNTVDCRHEQEEISEIPL